jgi:plastocyanin
MNRIYTIIIHIPRGGDSDQASFMPSTLTLRIGKNNTVQWVKDDSVTHTPTSTSAPNRASFDSDNLSPGATFTLALTTQGPTSIMFDPFFMAGTIIVKFG